MGAAMTSRLSSVSDGRGAALSALVADWASHTPKVRRVWLAERGERDALSIALELQPVGDSEESMPLWMAHCEQWRRELASRLGRDVDLGWLDPDEAARVEQPRPGETDTLIYERSRE